MVKILSFLLYKLLKFCDFLLKFFNRSSIIYNLNKLIRHNSYIVKNLNNKKIKFFVPNLLTLKRTNKILIKEPNTLQWIDQFKVQTDEEIVFWDIGSNIGLFSIYACSKHKNIKVYSFEPSFNNLVILSRNIDMNNLSKKIFICQFPLSKYQNRILSFKESQFEEGTSLNVFNEDFDFEGKKISVDNEYKIFGTTIDFLTEKKIINFPHYIKIDVDGIEHLVLEGSLETLKNSKIKSIIIEINFNFKEQKEKSFKILENSGFKFIGKSNTSMSGKNSDKFSNSYNCIFEKRKS